MMLLDNNQRSTGEEIRLEPNSSLGSVRSVKLSHTELWILALLVVSAIINYIDRTTLSVGAVSIQHELRFSDYQLGILLSTFFWPYALLQLVGFSGWLVDRFHVGWVYAGGFLLWSAATAATGVCSTFAALFGFRLLLGAAESIAQPAYSRMLATFPEQRRGLANAVIDAGIRTGPAVGTLIGGLLIARFGWRMVFLALALGGAGWLVLWFFSMPRNWVGFTQTDSASVATKDILEQRSAWFTFIGHFCGNYIYYFLITWLPSYLQKARGFSTSKMAVLGALALIATPISSVISGWLSDRWIARGGTPTRVRKTFTGGGLGLAAIIFMVSVVHNDVAAMIFLLLACTFLGMWGSNQFAITQTLGGLRAAGRWTSFQNGFGNLAGVAAPWLTGWVLRQTGHFYLAFVVAAVVALVGSASFIFGVGPVKEVIFRSRTA